MKTLVVSLLLAAALPALAAPPVVSNIRASQRPGTKLADVYYDLSDADGGTQLIQMAVSDDGGLTYTIPCPSVSGDIGSGISLGANKHIIWNAGADWGGNFVARTKVRVTAHDGTTPPAPSGMAYIPSGPFQMGDNLDGDISAMPVHNVQVDGFFMDKNLVSKELWQAVQTWGNSYGYSISGGSFKATSHPVQTISWYDAVKWCNARSQKEGLTPCYYTDAAQTVIYKIGTNNIDNTMVKWSASGYRLPTEAEWEKAARGGMTGYRFPWGNTISHANANFCNNGGESYQTGATGYDPTWGTGSQPYTSPVGSFAPNAYGLYDMAGNLWEWCWDWLSSSYYGSTDSLTNPSGPAAGSDRVLRGGDWYDSAYNCRVANRDYDAPGCSSNSCGLRTVRR